MAQQDVSCVVCANKNDLTNEKQVDKKQIKEFGKSNDMNVYFTSAVTSENVQEAYQKIVFDCLNSEEARRRHSSTLKGDQENSHNVSLKISGQSFSAKRKKKCKC